ncbi:MAG: Fis family transcriptional regulator [Spirochaetes bacterium DG_61]|nr:MAG: Fis family transcriptional regulator [Spirochaetes bacterium DG_61]
MKSVLVIDDEKNIRETLKDVLEDDGYTVFLAGNGKRALDMLDVHAVDVVLLDLWLPEMGGMEVLEEIKKHDSDLPVVIISGHGTIDLAVKATKVGAFDFIEKPLSIERVLTVIDHAIKIDKLRQENLALRQRSQSNYYMVNGTSRAFAEVQKLIESCAQSNSRVLISGENGTGKEVVARRIHEQSKRSAAPFVAVNCAAIPQTLIEAELFGYQKGAFTGAVSDKRGKFELADGGTIFLDEIADMTLEAQAKVLRVLEELQIERIGGVTPIKIDVRVIAATNKDLSVQIEKNLFREDLYYRLNVVPIHIAPLRKRREDIPELIEHYLDYFARDSNRPRKSMSEDARRFLMEQYEWPGNIRELKNLIERLTILIQSDDIGLEDVRNNIPQRQEDALSVEGYEFNEHEGLRSAKENFERNYIISTLKRNDYNISKAAQVLKVERSNLYKIMKRLGID